MICRGALAYRPPLFRVQQVRMRESVGVTLLVYRVRFSFQRLRRVLLNAHPGLRSMTISGARESFVDASHVRLTPRRVQPRKLRPRKLRRDRRRLQILRTLMCRRLKRHRQSRRHRQSKRRHRVQLLDLRREVMKAGGVLCDLQWMKARNA